MVGDDLVAHCEAIGKYPMLYQWFKEGLPLKNKTSKELTLAKVKPVDEGLYICRVANVRGYQFSRWIRVVVEKPQTVEIVECEKSESEVLETVENRELRRAELPKDDDGCLITQSGEAINHQCYELPSNQGYHISVKLQTRLIVQIKDNPVNSRIVLFNS